MLFRQGAARCIRRAPGNPSDGEIDGLQQFVEMRAAKGMVSNAAVVERLQDFVGVAGKTCNGRGELLRWDSCFFLFVRSANLQRPGKKIE